ncbi:MAG: protein kinase [Chlamydiales bacterium]|nr:protein kinase [Chlamydiia bacterium]MCP5507198.1 protein kinase [Chlamydiales bacterium]
MLEGIRNAIARFQNVQFFGEKKAKVSAKESKVSDVARGSIKEQEAIKTEPKPLAKERIKLSSENVSSKLVNLKTGVSEEGQRKIDNVRNISETVSNVWNTHAGWLTNRAKDRGGILYIEPKSFDDHYFKNISDEFGEGKLGGIAVTEDGDIFINLGEKLGAGGVNDVFLAVKIGSEAELAAMGITKNKKSAGAGEEESEIKRYTEAQQHLLEVIDGHEGFAQYHKIGVVEKGYNKDLQKEEFRLGHLMKLYPGGDLEGKAGKIADKDQQVSYAYQAASALAFGHEKGFTFHDVSPDNFFIEDGRLVLSDFGTVRENVHEMDDKDIKGKYRYFSPEINRYLDKKSNTHDNQLLTENPRRFFQGHDVFAWGVTMHQMIHGKDEFPPEAPDRSGNYERSEEPADKNSLEHIIWEALDPVVNDRPQMPVIQEKLLQLNPYLHQSEEELDDQMEEVSGYLFPDNESLQDKLSAGMQLYDSAKEVGLALKSFILAKIGGKKMDTRNDLQQINQKCFDATNTIKYIKNTMQRDIPKEERFQLIQEKLDTMRESFLKPYRDLFQDKTAEDLKIFQRVYDINTAVKGLGENQKFVFEKERIGSYGSSKNVGRIKLVVVDNRERSKKDKESKEFVQGFSTALKGIADNLSLLDKKELSKLSESLKELKKNNWFNTTLQERYGKQLQQNFNDLINLIDQELK